MSLIPLLVMAWGAQALTAGGEPAGKTVPPSGGGSPPAPTMAADGGGSQSQPVLYSAKVYGVQPTLDAPPEITNLDLSFLWRTGYIIDMDWDASHVISLTDDHGTDLTAKLAGDKGLHGYGVQYGPSDDAHQFRLSLGSSAVPVQGAKTARLRAVFVLRLARARVVAVQERLPLRVGSRFRSGPMRYWVSGIQRQGTGRHAHLLVMLASHQPGYQGQSLTFFGPDGHVIESLVTEARITGEGYAYGYDLYRVVPWVKVKAVYYLQDETLPLAVDQRVPVVLTQTPGAR